ncbi:MAG TPA: tRNA (N(6)-L-threonylcarbamoyladenosine(37)-C(2))-methylthiotransferase MtaB [Candidatus Margulisiibacteriota bacterium]|nr:tRNA (N(6)-L-threonylcarbamoyladenosine(37)-C(2))-methylthiotransferase MtaB [Candidatus Margulisiibacteriota bacterium]
MRVAVATLGCKVNQYDTAAIETRLRGDGCTIVAFEPGADVYIVNSCTVTDRADAESRQLARRARRFNPAARVIMTGCFAQVNPQAAAIPEVDHVVGLNRLTDVLRAVRGAMAAAGERIAADDVRTARQVKTLGADSFTGQTRAFLKIQEGCDLFCSFCIVPFSRGGSRSVPPRQVLGQLQHLAARGFQEVVLTGVHLGGYGPDLDPPIGLCDLLEMILEQPPVPRIRLSSIDPPEVTPRLLDLLQRSPALCPHLHIPVQAGTDEVLRRMRRKYDTQLLRDLGAEIRSRLPAAAIGTDVIAGFPGESDAQFEAGMALLEALPLTYFHVFPYSRRSGTTAAKLPDHVAAATIRRRAVRLRILGERKRSAFARGFVGHTLPVLAEHGAAQHAAWLDGYSRNYQRVRFPGAAALANREVMVRISSADGARLTGMIAQSDG